jgi:hypothetical protein
MARQRLRLSQWLNPRAWSRSLLALNDTPRRIALGAAIGIFIGLTPTAGIQMVLVLLVAPFVQFNRVAALVTVYISNPVTMLPMYYANYKVGTLFFADTFTYAEFSQVFSDSWRESLRAMLLEVSLPLLTGSLIVAASGALLTYPLMLWLMRWFRQAAPHSDLPETVSFSETANS